VTLVTPKDSRREYARFGRIEGQTGADQDCVQGTGQGAQIGYSTDDPSLINTIHQWFDAQLSDHARHAVPEPQSQFTAEPANGHSNRAAPCGYWMYLAAIPFSQISIDSFENSDLFSNLALRTAKIMRVVTNIGCIITYSAMSIKIFN
jgi:hypothetical protein